MEQNKYYTHIDHIFYINHVHRKEPVNMNSYHYHNVYELCYLISGERYIFVQDKIYQTTKGNLVILNKYDIHKINDIGHAPYERIIIEFNDDFLKDLLQYINDTDLFCCFNNNLHLLNLNISEQNIIENKLREMIYEYKNHPEGFSSCLKAKLIDFLIFVNRLSKEHKSVPKVSQSHKHQKVSKIVKYINVNYAEALTLSDIAAEFNYSDNYLCTLFKEGTGFSIIEYLNGVRIKESQKLLRETHLTVTEISQKVGYENITHFGRVFKQITGTSPLKYRKYKLSY
jgi:YesN/AraC family two-component response regulator